MYVLTNVASGNELHKEAVMNLLFPTPTVGTRSIIFKFLQNNDSRLRTVAAWTLVNLTLPSSSGASSRVSKLRSAGIVSQLKNIINDPCLDVKVHDQISEYKYVYCSAEIYLLNYVNFLF